MPLVGCDIPKMHLNVQGTSREDWTCQRHVLPSEAQARQSFLYLLEYSSSSKYPGDSLLPRRCISFRTVLWMPSAPITMSPSYQELSSAMTRIPLSVVSTFTIRFRTRTLFFCCRLSRRTLSSTCLSRNKTGYPCLARQSVTWSLLLSIQGLRDTYRLSKQSDRPRKLKIASPRGLR